MTFKHTLSSGLLASVAALAACEIPARNPSDPLHQVVQVIIVPESLSLYPAQQFRFAAYGRTASGDSSAVPVSWSATGGSIAPDGMFTADTAAGDFLVSGTSAALNLSASSLVWIRRRPVASVTVSPAAVSLQLGQTRQLTATPRDSAGYALPWRPVTWASSDTVVATISGSGLVTANAEGSATITATSEGQSGSAAVTVTTVPVATVSVTPASLSLTAGQTGQLTATPQDASGTPLTGRVVTWVSSNTVVATVSGSGLVTAKAAGSATITATSEGQSGSATVTTTAATAVTGLDFPGNVAVTSTMRFEFTSPFAAYPATYIWRVNPRQQGGYYTAFFHANNSSNFNNQYQYYGFHPYPEPPPPLQGTEKWEISVDGGNDITGDPVVFNRWYLQVAVVEKTASNTRHTYYWDWPDTTHKIVWVGSLYAAAPNPAIMVGDNPWNPGEEVFDGVMRGFQFYDAKLTPSQIVQEIAAPGSVRQPWYLNLNPTPTDISDKSGNAHHPSWVGTQRPTLWTGSGP